MRKTNYSEIKPKFTPAELYNLVKKVKYKKDIAEHLNVSAYTLNKLFKDLSKTYPDVY